MTLVFNNMSTIRVIWSMDEIGFTNTNEFMDNVVKKLKELYVNAIIEFHLGAVKMTPAISESIRQILEAIVMQEARAKAKGRVASFRGSMIANGMAPELYMISMLQSMNPTEYTVMYLGNTPSKQLVDAVMKASPDKNVKLVSLIQHPPTTTMVSETVATRFVYIQSWLPQDVAKYIGGSTRAVEIAIANNAYIMVDGAPTNLKFVCPNDEIERIAETWVATLGTQTTAAATPSEVDTVEDDYEPTAEDIAKRRATRRLLREEQITRRKARAEARNRERTMRKTHPFLYEDEPEMEDSDAVKSDSVAESTDSDGEGNIVTTRGDVRIIRRRLRGGRGWGETDSERSPNVWGKPVAISLKSAGSIAEVPLSRIMSQHEFKSCLHDDCDPRKCTDIHYNPGSINVTDVTVPLRYFLLSSSFDPQSATNHTYCKRHEAHSYRSCPMLHFKPSVVLVSAIPFFRRELVDSLGARNLFGEVDRNLQQNPFFSSIWNCSAMRFCNRHHTECKSCLFIHVKSVAGPRILKFFQQTHDLVQSLSVSVGELSEKYLEKTTGNVITRAAYDEMRKRSGWNNLGFRVTGNHLLYNLGLIDYFRQLYVNRCPKPTPHDPLTCGFVHLVSDLNKVVRTPNVAIDDTLVKRSDSILLQNGMIKKQFPICALLKNAGLEFALAKRDEGNHVSMSICRSTVFHSPSSCQLIHFATEPMAVNFDSSVPNLPNLFGAMRRDIRMLAQHVLVSRENSTRW